MKHVYHCPKCKIERGVEDGFIKDHGLQVTKCPRCGAWMAKGPLPLEPPDLKELAGLRKALAAAREAIAKQRPGTIEALKAELEQTRVAIAQLQKETLELQEREANLAALRKQEEALKARLAGLERAEREAKTRELEARLHQPWPGEKELIDALHKWRKKYEGAFEEAVRQWQEEARAVGGVAGYPPGIDEILRRAWKQVWSAKGA